MNRVPIREVLPPDVWRDIHISPDVTVRRENGITIISRLNQLEAERKRRMARRLFWNVVGVVFVAVWFALLWSWAAGWL